MRTIHHEASHELVFRHAFGMFCFYAILLALLLLSLPLNVYAADTGQAVVSQTAVRAHISEIMFDPPGTDTGHEWVEVVAETELDWSKLAFREEGVNHKISAEGSIPNSIQAGAAFVIADDPAKFRSDHPAYSGLLFNSTFSLKNTGEEIGLGYDGAQIFTVTYNPELGAKGDGNSLQNSAGSAWVAQKENPGIVTVPVPVDDAVTVAASTAPALTTTVATSTTVSVNQTDVVPLGGYQSEYVALAAAIPDAVRVSIVGEDGGAVSVLSNVVGAAVRFHARGIGLKKVELPNARYSWNFGDGVIRDGQHVEHVYTHPGQYMASVTVSSGVWSATDAVVVNVGLPTFFLRQAAVYERDQELRGFITLSNTAKVSAQLERFQLVFRNSSVNESARFTFDAQTIISQKNELRLAFAHIFSRSNPVVDRLLRTGGQLTVSLEYPNGRLLNSVLLTRVKTESFVPGEMGYRNTTARICHYE